MLVITRGHLLKNNNRITRTFPVFGFPPLRSLKMATEIVSVRMKNGGSFHGFFGKRLPEGTR